ncbi:MAG: tRNA pseudouridine(54/55) synthase Pus10 [Promethearchaeia archaeon]
MTEYGKILETAIQVLEDIPICNRCLGRQFAWLSTDSDNEERGHAIKLLLSMYADEFVRTGESKKGYRLIKTLAENGMFPPAKSLADDNSLDYQKAEHCHLCSIEGKSVFSRIPRITENVIDIEGQMEFDTYLVGCVPVPILVERQDEIRARHNLLHGEPLKSDFNRELGKSIYEAIGKEVDFERPDIVFIYEMENDRFRLQINPLFLQGRYRKLERGIPQSRWDCPECHGKGCEACDGTGRKYPDSISEYIGVPIRKAAKGTDFKFHAGGREDIDALMLGSGRPFVVEVSEPRKRDLDLEELQERINQEADGKVEVIKLQPSDKDAVHKLKSEASENIKEYEALIQTDADIEESSLSEAESRLSDITIKQRTPNRVAHRRGDLVRKKRIYEVRVEKIGEKKLKGFFRVQGGTYVKELISGDEGRTKPSLSEELGVLCACEELNVVAIYGLPVHHNP